MSDAVKFFREFWGEVKKTEAWARLENTVEGSEWHRESNVAVHTTMAIEHYIGDVLQADTRPYFEQVMTLMSLLFHDFGKPEAEETRERADGSGTYHRYAGHEPKSANEFISFMCDHPELVKKFFAAGFSWKNIRQIKFMIEQHLPFGLKNATKRQNLRNVVAYTLGEYEQCFYDQLWSDCCGRISDDHETKKQAVIDWITEFRLIPVTVVKPPKFGAPSMYVLCGPVGVGKTTWMTKFQRMNHQKKMIVVSEDNYRIEFVEKNMPQDAFALWCTMSRKDAYAKAWQFCFDHSKEYDKYAREQLLAAASTGQTVILDRTNQTRKSRGPWITAAKSAGYQIIAVEFYISEATVHARQKSRPDKDVPYNRAHQIYMAMETPWYPFEVDEFEIVPPW